MELPLYGIDGDGWFLSYHCFAKYIKVAFFRGASLQPVPPGKSKQKDVRYLDIYEGRPTRREPVYLLGRSKPANCPAKRCKCGIQDYI